jgi:hypothetical protein
MEKSVDRETLWRANVARWKEKYPDPKLERGKYNPTLAHATPLRCVKCHTDQMVSRHHKGHEYIFACIMPEWYASRYVRFVRTDWIPLCYKCHARIHEIYTPIIDAVKLYIRERIAKIEIIKGEQVITWKYKPDRRALESFRKQMIARCDRWLRSKNKKYRVGKYKPRRSPQL